MNYLMLDVESNGLYGDPFAWGYVIVNDKGTILKEDICWYNLAQYEPWVQENVLPALTTPHIANYWDLFTYFREAYVEIKNKYDLLADLNGKIETLYLCADCPYPVETNFLQKIFINEPYLSPLPIIDVASVRLAKGLYPIETCPRLPNESPAHNPLNDARQSARLLIEALNDKI